MKNRIIIIIISLLTVFWGCKEEGRIDHIDKNAPAPAQVTGIEVRNTPGGAVLTYTVPKDENLLYVRAECERKPGVVSETKSSYYKDSLVLEGFGEEREYDVQVYSVGKNEKASDPVTVKIHPTTAPIHLATVQMTETFSGVAIRLDNPLKADLAIVLMGDTAHLGYQTTLRTFYTSREWVVFKFRGLNTVAYNFSLYMCDLWDNLSNTVEATVTPWFEEEILKETWEEYTLPSDALPYPAPNQYAVRYLWDNIYMTNAWIGFLGRNEEPFPQWITWDLGVTAVISRFVIWHLNTGSTDRIYQKEAPRKIELWGSTNPNLDGSWDDSWIPLGEYDCLPPSGNIIPTADDLAYEVANGHECEIEETDFAPDPFVPVRYLRFKTLETFWGPLPFGPIALQEFDFFGVVQNQ